MLDHGILEYTPQNLARKLYEEYCTYHQIYAEQPATTWENLTVPQRLALERTCQNLLKEITPEPVVVPDVP